MTALSKMYIHELEQAQDMQPASAVEYAINVYLMAKAEIDAFTAVQDAAKKLIYDVMTETGKTDYTTPLGTASMTKPGQSVSYDVKALDILLRDDADLAVRLSPYRKESVRPGTLRIVGAK